MRRRLLDQRLTYKPETILSRVAEIALPRIPDNFVDRYSGHNYWFIAIKQRGEDIFNLDHLTVLKPPPGRFWADPFLADKYLFFEDYDYNKGVISVGELDGMALRNVRPVLDEHEHLSFPSVLHDRRDWYMTPERRNAGLLRVYRATTFPDHWEPLVDVTRGRFDDPLLSKTENGFEIWATREEGPRRHKTDVLHVFAAEYIEGPWREVRTHKAPFQRAAGNFIGDLRPTQDARPIYGRSIKFLRGDVVVCTIEPTWHPNLTGTHTFNVSTTHVVIDGRVALEGQSLIGHEKQCRQRLYISRWMANLFNT